MKTSIQQNIFYYTLILSLLLIGCKPKEKQSDPVSVSYTSGVFVVNEGNFNHSNASVSYFNPDTKLVVKDAFKSSNNRPLGDVAQSMMINNGKGYIVVNNSNKVEVVNLSDFKSISSISGLASPRYMTAITNSKAYLTEWVSFSGNGNVDVVDLTSNSITNTIRVGASPENMLLMGGKIYVTNSGDSTVMVINTVTDKTEDTIKVADSPTSIVNDVNNNIWVLCAGNKVYDPVTYALDLAASTAGRLVKLDNNGTILLSLSFADKSEVPSNLLINKAQDVLYYNYAGDVYSFPISSTTLPSTPFINRNFYGLGIDPKNDFIYGGQAKDFIQTDYFYRYNNAGTLVDSFNVGIAPNGFTFTK